MTIVLNGTTGITSVNGSAAAPSVTGTDTDTGIVYGTNTLTLSTGGTAGLIQDASQNVGIGAAPAVGARLELRSTAKAVSWLASTNTSPNSMLMTGGNSYYYGVVGVNSTDNTAAGDQFHLGWTTSASAATNGVLLWGRAGNCIGLNTAPSTSGTGITFPATQSASSDANTLDDYEEGTWTPAYGGSGSTPTVTYAVQVGYYTKIGRQVTLICHLNASSSSGGSGTLLIANMPFAILNNDAARGGFQVNYAQGFSATTTPTSILVEQNATYAQCRTNDTSDSRSQKSVDVSVGAIASGGRLYLSITYFTS